MRYSIATAAAFVGAVAALPQAPATAASSECQATYPGKFQIQVVKIAKRDIAKRAPLELTLNDGVLKDSQDRIGYIAANNQFQFDNPVQTGTIYDKGWAVCSNGTLVLGPDAVFQQCLSGTFYNLYDENTSAQCDPVNIYVVGGGSGTANQIADGQVTASPVSQIPDGQIQGATNAVSQIGDGQIQAPTNVVSQIGDGQIQAPTGVVSQIGDGQIQAPTGVVSQIGDGQIQAPTGVVSQIGDGQIQAPTGVVSQIGDGQVQAPTGVVTQIGDGQIQAPTGAVVSQISDGQIQAPTNGTKPTVVAPSASVQPYTGAANTVMRSEFFGLAAGVLAVAML